MKNIKNILVIILSVMLYRKGENENHYELKGEHRNVVINSFLGNFRFFRSSFSRKSKTRRKKNDFIPRHA